MEDCGWLGRRVTRGVLLGVALLILVALVAASGTSAADGKTFTVDSIGNGADATIDSVCADMAGACSLRAAIQESNASVGSKDTIAFNIPAPHLIVLPALAAGSFPFVTDAVVIDGETQPHYAGTPLVEIDAGGRGAFGLLVIGDDSAGTEIRGIAIYGGDSGSDNAIDFDNPGSNVVERNFIGTDASGTTTKGRGGVAFRRGSSGDGSVSIENTIADNVIAGTSGPAVLLDEASDNQVLRNLIGTDASGTVGISQQEGVGISLGAGSGRNLLADNVIADRNRGIFILGPSPLNDHNRIERNLIGTDISGTVDLGNAVDGIAVDGVAPGTIIGGADPADRNVISGNGGSGVFVAIGTDTVIQGNLIGTDITGTNDLGNGGGGIGLAQTNGLTLIRDNVISGNEGIGISGGATAGGSLHIESNLIGTNEEGTAKIGNARDGISIGGNLAESVIGGESDAQRNVISGNGGTGVVSIGQFSPGLQILNNYVGTDTTGTADLGNVVDGIRISSVDVVVGAPGSGNLVSGNGRHGVVLGSESTLVQGNRIGTNAQGTAPLGNGGTGITTTCCYRDIRIGGGASGEGNLVAGNGAWGIDFLGSGAGNALVVVEGNRIGTNDAGNAPIANGAGGVHIENTNAFLKLLSNVVSGNSGDGVDVEAVGFDTTELFGNRIGTNDAGTAAIPNTQNGVKLGRASLGGKIFVGGLPPSQRNIISGNGANGIVVANGGHTIVGNFVGIDRDGTNAVPNTLSGLRVQVAPNEVHDNVFSGNGRDGVELLSGAQTLTRNLVGTGADGSSRLGNSRHGVSIEGSGASTQHVVGGQAGDGNTIAFNGGHGVLIHDAHVNFVERNEIFSNSGDGVAVVAGLPPRGAIRNKISENSISSNGGLGIDLQDDGVTPNDLGDGDGGSGFAGRANFLQNFPVNLEVSADGTTVTGTLNSRPNTTYQIELFGNSAGVACDPSGNGEGEEFLTATDVITDGSGNATIPDVPLPEALPAGHFVTATATDGGAFPGNTSEFSQCATPPGEIVVRKETVPDGSPQPFAFSGAITATLADGQSEGRTVAAGLYTVSEVVPAAWDASAIQCQDPSGDSSGSTVPVGPGGTATANFRVAAGETVTCTFTNTERGLVIVPKTVSGAPPSGSQAFAFELRQGASTISAGTTLESKSATAANGGVIAFTTTLVSGTTYALCEIVMPGWTTTLGPPVYVVYNAGGDNSTVCTDFTVAPGETKSFAIDNKPPPGGLGRTIGFWKNWSSCSKGNQKPVLDQTLAKAEPSGITIGILTLHGSASNPNTAPDCLKAVRLLDKSTIDSGKKSASDPAFNMAAQLSAAKLNLVAGAGSCPAAVSAINSGQALLAAIHFNGITHDKMSAAQSSQANSSQALSIATTTTCCVDAVRR